MNVAGIAAPFRYMPLHLSPMGRRFGGCPGDCPIAERVAEDLVRLPLFNSMTDWEQQRVIQVSMGFTCVARSNASLADGH